MFFKSRSYSTPYSPDEVRSNISTLLETKTKVLFFSVRTLFGSVLGEDFVVSHYQSFGLVATYIKGQIIAERETRVKLKFNFPALLMIFFVGVPTVVIAIVTPVILKMDVMTINDVVREPTWFERAGILAMCTIFPFVIIYFNLVHPLIRLRNRLILKLALTELPR